MKKLLTVVIPMYNVEKYIRLCLSSFIAEESIMRDVEILVIDDGSKDFSAEIAREYERRYPNTIRLIQKENGGHGSTINRGILEAKGKYLKVVDSDDWVDTSAFCVLVRKLRDCDSDIVYSNYYWVDDTSGVKSVEFQHPFEGVQYDYEYHIEEINEDYFLKMHGYTIKTEILRKTPQIDEHCFYVDMEFVLFPMPYVQTVTFLDEYVYRYRIGRSGQSMSTEKLMKQSENFDRVLYRLFVYYEEQKEAGLSRKKRIYMEHVLARMVVSRMKIFLCNPYSPEIQKEMKEMDSNIKKNYGGIYRAVQNKVVRCLQKSHYGFYPLARCAFYWKEKIQNDEITKIDFKRRSKRKYSYGTVWNRTGN